MRVGGRRDSLVALEGTALEGQAREFVEGLESCFADLDDPRVAASCKHLLIDILAITILGVASGADDWTELETFGKFRRK